MSQKEPLMPADMAASGNLNRNSLRDAADSTPESQLPDAVDLSRLGGERIPPDARRGQLSSGFASHLKGI